MHEVMEEEAFLSTLKEAIQLLIEAHSIHTKLATEWLVLKYNAMLVQKTLGVSDAFQKDHCTQLRSRGNQEQTLISKNMHKFHDNSLGHWQQELCCLSHACNGDGYLKFYFFPIVSFLYVKQSVSDSWKGRASINIMHLRCKQHLTR